MEEEFLTQQEAEKFHRLFQDYLNAYKKKDPGQTDQEWLENMFKKDMPERDARESRERAVKITDSIHIFGECMTSVHKAASEGTSKERWLADKIEEACTGMSVQEYGQVLEDLNTALASQNDGLAKALQRSQDGHIMMSPNLDGNIAEQMTARTAELSGILQGKNISVRVNGSFGKNSVDVSAVNHETGARQNYQLKYGKDAKATIELIERGNYNNQQIIVPSEQLEEVRAHFAQKGSRKTISDHIEAWGAKSKSFTKEDMKQLQINAQEKGVLPEMDYSHFQTREMALNVGKNAASMALQNAAVTTGLNIAWKLCSGKQINADELVTDALRTGADTSVKVAAAGALENMVGRDLIRFIPKSTPAGVIANIACVGVENAKILYKVSTGELSLTKGIDEMGRTTVSMVGGLAAIAKGALAGAKLVGWIPFIGQPLAVAGGFIGGMAAYAAGSSIGEKIYRTGKRLAGQAKSVCSGISKYIKKTVSKSRKKVRKIFH